MLTEQRRKQLDEIVKKMIINKEKDNDIQFVVNDFSKKYANESTLEQSKIQSAEADKTIAANQPTVGNVVKGVANLPIIKQAGQLGTGFLKEAGNTLNAISGLGQKIAGIKDVSQIPQNVLQKQGVMENIGGAAETIAEFLAPSGIISKGEKAVSEAIKSSSKINKLGKAVLPTVSRMAIEAGTVGGQTALREGTFDKNAKTNAIVAGLFPLAGAVSNAGKKALGGIGKKIQMSTIKPSLADVKDGFKIENVQKYNVGGSLEEIMAKTHNKMNELTEQLNKVNKDSNVAVNLNKVYQETLKDITKNKSASFGDIQANQRVLKSLETEIESVAGKNGLVDLVEATNIKRGAGTKGSWVFGSVDPDATSVERVYNNFYNKLKTAIEKAAPEGKVKAINDQIKELIPISNAVIRRIPIANRNNMISLTDDIGLYSAMFDPKALALLGINNLSKSAKFGSYLLNIANKSSKSPIISRVTGK